MEGNFWAEVASTKPEDLQKEARRTKLKFRWARTTFVTTDDEEVLQRTFLYACENATDVAMTKRLQEAAKTFTPRATGEEERSKEEKLKEFRNAVIGEMADANVSPPALFMLVEDSEDEDGKGKGKPTDGLSLHDPRAYLLSTVGIKQNTVTGKVEEKDDSDEEEEEEGQVKKNKLVAKGKKKKYVLLHETMQQMPQSMGISKNVTDTALVKVMTEEQEKKMLHMIAEAKHLSKDEKKNRFLEMAGSWHLQANKIALVKKDKTDRKSVTYLERQGGKPDDCDGRYAKAVCGSPEHRQADGEQHATSG